MRSAAIVLFLFAALLVLWPRWITIPFVVVAAWLAFSLLIGAHRLGKKRKMEWEDYPETVHPHPTRRATSRKRRSTKAGNSTEKAYENQ